MKNVSVLLTVVITLFGGVACRATDGKAGQGSKQTARVTKSRTQEALELLSKGSDEVLVQAEPVVIDIESLPSDDVIVVEDTIAEEEKPEIALEAGEAESTVVNEAPVPQPEEAQESPLVSFLGIDAPIVDPEEGSIAAGLVNRLREIDRSAPVALRQSGLTDGRYSVDAVQLNFEDRSAQSGEIQRIRHDALICGFDAEQTQRGCRDGQLFVEGVSRSEFLGRTRTFSADDRAPRLQEVSWLGIIPRGLVLTSGVLEAEEFTSTRLDFGLSANEVGLAAPFLFSDGEVPSMREDLLNQEPLALEALHVQTLSWLSLPQTSDGIHYQISQAADGRLQSFKLIWAVKSSLWQTSASDSFEIIAWSGARMSDGSSRTTTVRMHYALTSD